MRSAVHRAGVLRKPQQGDASPVLPSGGSRLRRLRLLLQVLLLLALEGLQHAVRLVLGNRSLGRRLGLRLLLLLLLLLVLLVLLLLLLLLLVLLRRIRVLLHLLLDLPAELQILLRLEVARIGDQRQRVAGDRVVQLALLELGV